MLLAPVDDLKPAGERTDDVHRGDLDPEGVESRLVDQSVAQSVQPVAPGVVIAEVVAARDLARLLDEPVGIEADR